MSDFPQELDARLLVPKGAEVRMESGHHMAASPVEGMMCVCTINLEKTFWVLVPKLPIYNHLATGRLTGCLARHPPFCLAPTVALAFRSLEQRPH